MKKIITLILITAIFSCQSSQKKSKRECCLEIRTYTTMDAYSTYVYCDSFVMKNTAEVDAFIDGHKNTIHAAEIIPSTNN